MKTWDERTDCCSWEGVACDADSGIVIGIDLGNACLNGSLKSSSGLFELHDLRRLNLMGNSLSSAIPIGLARLNKLESLKLSGNRDLHWRQRDFKAFAKNASRLTELDSGGVKISSRALLYLVNLSSLSSLRLEGSHLEGEFPPTVFSLPNIRDIDLGNNQNLTVSLPAFLSNTSLEELKIYNTSFSNKSLDFIANFKHLQLLTLSGCRIHGNIPSSIGNLSKLTALDLSKNALTGSFPSSMGNLALMTDLDLSSNNLHGNVPSSFKNLRNLNYIDLSHNNLSGLCPDFLQNLTQLWFLDLSFNNFSGSIPSWLFTIPSIQTLYLSNNQLSGPLNFPAESDNITSVLFSLYLSANNLEGHIPRSLSKFTSLLYLSLDQNRFEGQIPNSVWSLPHLDFMEIFGNKLSGFEDFSSAHISGTITYLTASHNRITGEIPHSICNLTLLERLDLSDNHLTGAIPQCLGSFKNSLSIIYLQRNHLSEIPSQIFSNASSLKTINLEENHLRGRIPRSLIHCNQLEAINVANNLIRDTFPSWLFGMPRLAVLMLRRNKFYGPVSSSNRGFSHLRIIDVSENGFVGSIQSDFFNNWKEMAFSNIAPLTSDRNRLMPHSKDGYYDDSIIFENKGISVDLEKTMNIFTLIDFSSNRLDGSIPVSIGKLKGLMALNLSGNYLTGHIPSSLAELSHLESLDLSQNELSGRIPQELGRLTSLAVMNFADNRLSGQIPQMTQLTAQPNSSFTGNAGLCGYPLQSCDDGDATREQQTDSVPEEDENPDVLVFWLGAIGYACGTMIGMTIGYFYVSWRPSSLRSIFGRRRR